LGRVRDKAFVEGSAYAEALATKTPQEISKPLLVSLVKEATVRAKHRRYLRLLWDRLSDSAKQEVAVELANELDEQVPSGHWWSPINVLAAFGCEGWERLPEITQLRLEAAIINDIHAGSFDIYGANTGNPGALGTYANEFWSYFGNRVGLVEAVITKLKSGWHNQNYIGKYFLSLLPSISDTPARRHLLIEALQYAVRNDAKLVVSNLETLPTDWQKEALEGGF
jgi:hypothetical protein